MNKIWHFHFLQVFLASAVRDNQINFRLYLRSFIFLCPLKQSMKFYTSLIPTLNTSIECFVCPLPQGAAIMNMDPTVLALM